MTTNKKPILYTGQGSAIANYESERPQASSDWGRFDKNDKQHKTILSLLHQANWTTNIGGRQVPDMVRFGNWLQSDKSPVKKPLLKMESKDVSKIIEACKGFVKSAY